MAHLVPHSRGGGGLTNTVPVVIPSNFNVPEIDSDEEPQEAEKGPPKLVGDARVVNRAFSRLRIAQACNAYLGIVGLGI